MSKRHNHQKGRNSSNHGENNKANKGDKPTCPICKSSDRVGKIYGKNHCYKCNKDF